MTTEAFKEVPAEALQLKIGVLQFADSDDGTTSAGDDGMYPFTMFARSPEPIEHWYWGRIVHDMAGMQLRKERCPIDYRHSEYEIIGYGDTFDASDDGLTISGQLVSLDEKDRAFEVANKGAKGVPYESSIDWRGSGIRIEELGEGASAEVNGETFEGPGVIVREWPLRAAAVTPYGADSDTTTQFSEQSAEADTVSVCLFSASGDSKVTTKNDAGDGTQQHSEGDGTETEVQTPENSQQHSEATPENPPAAGSVSTETLRQFNEAFGDQAMTYLTAGLTFDAATVAHKDHRIQQLETEVQQLRDNDDDEASAANTLKKFGDRALGEETPVNTPAGDGGDGEKKFKFADFFQVGEAPGKASK